MSIIYEGPSLIDGMPIVVIVTFDSDNSKTGNMMQTWILRSDMDPVTASRTGADRSICGDCIHRGIPHNDVKGWAKKRSCYVNLLFAPNVVYKSYVRGIYAPADDISEIGRGQVIRVGSYGDPAAVPQHIWDQLLQHAAAWTAYTHNPVNPDPQRLMTSADTLAQAHDAWARGERTFRVLKTALDLQPTEILCPASAEAGKRTTCANCKLCAGASIAAKNIAIVVHGNGASHFA
jgi:hypothetical protein